MVAFYEGLFEKQIRLEVCFLDGMEFRAISGSKAEKHEEPFSEEELKKDINALKKDKALGPYGFLISFFLKF